MFNLVKCLFVGERLIVEGLVRALLLKGLCICLFPKWDRFWLLVLFNFCILGVLLELVAERLEARVQYHLSDLHVPLKRVLEDIFGRVWIVNVLHLRWWDIVLVSQIGDTQVWAIELGLILLFVLKLLQHFCVFVDHILLFFGEALKDFECLLMRVRSFKFVLDQTLIRPYVQILVAWEGWWTVFDSVIHPGSSNLILINKI